MPRPAALDSSTVLAIKSPDLILLKESPRPNNESTKSVLIFLITSLLRKELRADAVYWIIPVRIDRNKIIAIKCGTKSFPFSIFIKEE